MTARDPVPARPTHAADLFVVLNGTRLRFRDEGRGPAVLLVHGWTLDLEMWNPQVSALRDSFRLIRLDRRGHGCSGGIATPQRDAEDLGALCSHLGLERVALLGMSQGARAVLGFAATAPGQVSAVILDGPPALEHESDPDLSLERYAALVRAHGMQAFRREWARDPLMQLRTSDPESRALLAAMIARYPGTDLAQPAPRAEPATGIRLESLRVATLILSGAHDLPGRRRVARQLATRLADAELAVVPGAGHLANLDNPDAYNRVCRRFLRRHCLPDNS